MAKDTAKTIAEAKNLWWMVDRPNAYIKIPATQEGLEAITETIAQGISVNVTLIFSLERHGEVIDAYMAGLEKAKANAHDLSTIFSVASFFVSRMDTEVDARLDKLGTPEATALRGKAAIANARLAYELFENKCATERWQALAAGRGQRPAAAVGLDLDQGPAFPDTMYVVDLVVRTRSTPCPRPPQGRRRPRRAARRHGHGPTTIAGSSSPTWKSSASATTTWCSCSRTRAWRSSRLPGTSCSTDQTNLGLRVTADAGLAPANPGIIAGCWMARSRNPLRDPRDRAFPAWPGRASSSCSASPATWPARS